MDGTYLEVEAVRHCIQLLESRHVVVLSGREGSGKSRNGLEILRQLKERHSDFDVFKLIGLHYVSDIVKCNMTSIVLFDDAFDKTGEQFSYDKQVLDHLNSYICQNKVKLIFTMRNTVKHACQKLLSTHIIFHGFVDIDLNSKKFKLTEKEKEKMFTNYCAINKIVISEEEEDDDTAHSVSNEAEWDEKETIQSLPDQAAVILKREIMIGILHTDPFLGFPECCRLFTENRNNTSLDASYFKWPSAILVNDIEKLRIEGKDNYINGLKYVTLIYILTGGTSDHLPTICELAKAAIDAETCKQIYNFCNNTNVAVHTSDIDYVCKVLTGRYLVYKDKTYSFQHKAIQDSVLISYSKINLKATIPLLSFDHVVDIVRAHNYTEQEDEIVIKISKPYYPELVIRIFSIMESLFYEFDLDRFIESKLITENDIDLVYQLILRIQNERDTLNHYSEDYISHFFPLYLLRNIGKLDDKMLTVIHTEDQMLISVTIGDKTITLSIDPLISLTEAFQSKYNDIFKWLLKNTDHSLLQVSYICDEIMPEKVLEYTKLLLENVNHNMINMTQIFIDTCFRCNNKEKYQLDWIVDNVDNSLIDYYKCIKEMIDEDRADMVLLILKKVNHRWLNIDEVLKVCCKHGCSEIVEWVLKNVDHKLFDEEELLNITIGVYKEKEHFYDYSCFGMSEIVELLILQKPGIICCNINKLFDLANRNRWYDVLELLFKHDSNLSINRDRIIEDIFKLRNYEEQDSMHGDYEDVYLDDEHCQTIIQLMIKYFLHDIDVNKIFKKAVEVGFNNVVEELLLDKIDNISHYLDITLDKLRHQHFNQYGYFKGFYGGHGKILLLLLQKVNTKFIDLNSVMNDVCHIGHSPAVLWLLENDDSYRFEMRNIMNSACFHGDIKLVDYLFQKYSAADFDFKTAMVKACRNSQRETLDVCKWLWEKIDRVVFDMKAALNNACKYDKYEIVKWILTDVETGLFDIEAALLCACEHGNGNTVQLLLNQSSINMLDIQSAIIKACRNEDNGLYITKKLYKRSDKSTVDMNAVFKAACKTYRSDIVQWIIEICDKNIVLTETRDGQKNFLKSLDKTFVDMNQAITCILDMNAPEQIKEQVNKTKIQLLWLIIKSNPKIIHIYELLTETCIQDWVEIFQWILGIVDHGFLNIGEVINVACRNGALNIVKWSLENIDIQLIDVDNVMVESCGLGWLECLVLIWKNCSKYKLQAAMSEACTYRRLLIAEWLLQNSNHQCFNLRLLLMESGRNGWENIFHWLVTNFNFYRSDLQMVTKEALVNGNMDIIQLMFSYGGREGFDMSTLPDKVYAELKNENVVTFLLRNFDLRCLNLAILMTNACKFGWIDIVALIIDNDSNCFHDRTLDLTDISSSIIGKHVSCLCDFTLAFNTACDNGEAEIVKLLIIDVNHKIFAVQKAMLSVCIKGWDEIAVLLLDKFKHTRLDIGNALIEACRHGEIDVVQAILRKVKHNLLDVKTALNEACENHMHEELVLWILENIDQEQVDLKTLKIQAVRHKWRKVQFALTNVDIDDLYYVEQETETDNIIILE